MRHATIKMSLHLFQPDLALPADGRWSKLLSANVPTAVEQGTGTAC
jgi:hypothetical protein